jgi:hypothetical protein
LDAHFTLEQVGRNSKLHFINFNGTAGYGEAMYSRCGNWESDTHQDLDLSYRAQLKAGNSNISKMSLPAELPAIISARSQQFRWNKGGAEISAKSDSSTTIRIYWVQDKAHGMLHLLNSTMFLAIFTMAILSVPMLYIKNEFAEFEKVFDLLIFFFITSILFLLAIGQLTEYSWRRFQELLKYITLFITFYTIAMGFSFHNTIVLEGLWGRKVNSCTQIEYRGT